MQPGDVIAGRFTIERIAGSGGMGEVYRAIDRGSGERGAVKARELIVSAGWRGRGAP